MLTLSLFWKGKLVMLLNVMAILLVGGLGFDGVDLNAVHLHVLL